ncbi:MAG: hypothetical protein U0350_16055 [Caldilineaceae bacterium]
MSILRIKLEQEVSNYFLDNGDLTFELQVAIEGLVFTNGKPTLGEHEELPGNVHVWRNLNHLVVYKIDNNLLNVWVVKPLT